ncbi:MAG TPA: hypothetical protein VFF70_09785 [Anaerolineae bacterium]|nr:hypothetical protein [Anaerolineae bacterium]
MKRSLMIGLAILPAAVLIAIATLGTPGILGVHVPTTQDQVSSAIDSYLQYRAPRARSINSIQQLIPASLPGNFTSRMSKATFGNGNYFKSDFHSTHIPVMWLGQKPLPYPPTDVWCARLLPSGNSYNSYPDIVFIAQHEDDYHAEWIVHDPATETRQQLTADLAALGCSEVEQP